MLSKKILLVGAALAAAITVAALPQLLSLDSTREGEGQVRYSNRSSDTRLTRVSLFLNRNGTFEVKARDGLLDTFAGRWRETDNRRIRLEVERVGRQQATGSGRVTHDGRGEFTEIIMDGRVAGVRFDFEFKAGRQSGGGSGGPGGNWGIQSLNTWRNGDGAFVFRSRSGESRVDRLDVNLKRDKTFEIRVRPTMETLYGKWWQESSNTVRLDMDRIGRDPATGQGTLSLIGDTAFNEVRVNGRIGNSDFRLSFSADRTSGNPGGGTSDDRDPTFRRFREAARDAVEGEFGRGSRFQWRNERLADPAFGERLFNGEVTVRGGNRPGEYTFRVRLGANTVQVKSVSVTRR